jgi:molybdate transport system substrate-binding protein
VTASRQGIVAAVALAALGCDAQPAASSPAVRVVAASSLAAVFDELADGIEAGDGGARPTTSFAGSAQLAAQLRAGASACVFASADEATMRQVVDAGLCASAPVVFARNRLAIVVRAGNPKGVRGLSDLARPDLVVLLGAPDVPAGRYGRQALAKAGVAVRAASDEPNVRAIVGKVRAGEADAGLVYRTDCRAQGVEGVALDPDHDVVAAYPIAVLQTAVDRACAEQFVARVLGDEGRAALQRHGFELP